MKKKLYIAPESSIIPMAVMVMQQISDRAHVTDTPEGVFLDNVKGDGGNAYDDAASNNALWGWNE